MLVITSMPTIVLLPRLHTHYFFQACNSHTYISGYFRPVYTVSMIDFFLDLCFDVLYSEECQRKGISNMFQNVCFFQSHNQIFTAKRLFAIDFCLIDWVGFISHCNSIIKITNKDKI